MTHDETISRIDQTLAETSDDAAAWTDEQPIEEPTGPDTLYATWLNVTGELSVAAGIAEALSTDGRDLDAGAIEADYRRAIASVLDEDGRRIRLVGDEFIVPEATRDEIDHDELRELVRRVDFWEVAERQA